MPEKCPLFLDFANSHLQLKKLCLFSRKWVRACYTLWSEWSKQTHYAIMTSLLRQNDVIFTSKWRRFRVITTLLSHHVFSGVEPGWANARYMNRHGAIWPTVSKYFMLISLMPTFNCNESIVRITPCLTYTTFRTIFNNCIMCFQISKHIHRQ